MSRRKDDDAAVRTGASDVDHLAFLTQVRERLDDLAEVDDDALARLRTARAAAVAHVDAVASPRTPAFSLPRWAAVAPTLAVLLVMALLLRPGPTTVEPDLAQTLPREALDGETSALVQDLELLDEMEFIAWLELDAAENRNGAG